MKKICTLGLLCCGLFTTAQAQTEEAVGINTENPKGVLHIDGAANNPSSGIISPAQAADDVVIDESGRLGIGVTAPAAKVHIYSDTPGEALRIVDGTQGDGKVLISDADGKASWGTGPGAWWYAALFDSERTGFKDNAVDGNTTAFANYERSTISSISEGEVYAATGTISVPFAGKYRITLNVHFMSDRTTEASIIHYKGTAIIRVTHGGTTSDRLSPSAWGGRSGAGTNPSFMAIFNLEAGDMLSVLLDHTLPYGANDAQSRVFMVEFLQ
jgi:hypothetical protein